MVVPKREKEREGGGNKHLTYSNYSYAYFIQYYDYYFLIIIVRAYVTAVALL